MPNGPQYLPHQKADFDANINKSPHVEVFQGMKKSRVYG